jgi:hypothetical protein
MTDYRDHFSIRPDIPTYRDRSATGYAGPLIALAVIAVLIAGVFFLASGTPQTGVSGDPAAPAAMDTAPAAPATMDTAPAAPATTESAAQ